MLEMRGKCAHCERLITCYSFVERAKRLSWKKNIFFNIHIYLSTPFVRNQDCTKIR